MRAKTVAIVAVVIIVLGLAGYLYTFSFKLEEVNVQPGATRIPLFRTKLDNGMEVTVKEVHTLPLVTIQFWIKVGSRYEPAGAQGIAHIFEHIWFKGTPTQPVGSFFRKVESVGGTLNAMTAHDWTMYYVTIPSNKFDEIFPLMADLLLNPLFDPEEVEREKQVVLEEQRSYFNDPELYTDTEFGKLLIDKHPYRNPIIGYKETISAANKSSISEFYRAYYVPNNMNAMIIGDIDTARVVDSVKQTFAAFEPKPLPKLELPKESLPTMPKYNSTARDIGFVYAALGFMGPAFGNEDWCAMSVLNAIFSVGESSRLQRIIKTQKQLIVKGNSVFVPLKDFGVFELMATIDPAKRDEAVLALITELNRFKTEPVSAEELARAKRLVHAEWAKTQELIEEQGIAMGPWWATGNLDKYENYLENIDKVTIQDVVDVARKYFTAYTLYELKPS